MFFKNNMRPAFATAGDNGSAKADRKKIKELFMAAEQSAEDDSSAFGSYSEKPNTPDPEREKARQEQLRQQRARQQRAQQAQRAKRSKKSTRWDIIIPIAAVVAAVVLLIVILVAIFSAPQKNIKIEDNVYFTYIDADGNYRVMSNGDLLDEKFEGEIVLTPSADRSFAYIFEDVADEEDTGTKMYILKGSKLKEIEALADEVIDIAEYEPGIIYKEGSNFTFYSADEHSPITSKDNADNFMITGNAEAVIYTTEAADESIKLNYFAGGISLVIGRDNITPLAVSADGRYVYGIHSNGGANHSLVYVEVEDDGEKSEAKMITTSNAVGNISSITAMNVKGNEIIFCTQKTTDPDIEDGSAGYVSYMYKIKDSEPKQIAEGKFIPIYSDKNVVCPETFLNSYFICEKTINVTEDGEDKPVDVTYTYYLDKSKGARLMAETTGTFSADGDYFYYVNDSDEHSKSLVRVKLGSKDFSKDIEPIMNDVHNFSVIENGDVYVMREEDARLNKGHIYFWDSSTGKPTRISYNANLDSMSVCANSIFFEETDGEDVTTIYVSVEGSAKEKAEFKSSKPTVAPTVIMGSGKKGYAYFIDESGDAKLFYTSNGKKFSLKEKSCTIVDYNDSDAGSGETNTPEA